MKKTINRTTAAIEFIAAMLVDAIEMMDKVTDEKSFKDYIRKTGRRYPNFKFEGLSKRHKKIL